MSSSSGSTGTTGTIAEQLAKQPILTFLKPIFERANVKFDSKEDAHLELLKKLYTLTAPPTPSNSTLPENILNCEFWKSIGFQVRYYPSRFLM